MNTRQLSQGMKPTLEFERMHTFKSFRQFPELRQSVTAIENIAFASADPTFNKKSGNIRRKKIQTSTHHLSTLSQSSLSDVSSVMDDFRKIMIDNRRKNNKQLMQQLQPRSQTPEVSVASSNSSSVTKAAAAVASAFASGDSKVPFASSTSSVSQLDDDMAFTSQDEGTTRMSATSPTTYPMYEETNDHGENEEGSPQKKRPTRSNTRASFFSSAEALSDDPLLRANDKLRRIAMSFDSTSYNSHLAGFQGAKLAKVEFAMLLRRCLNIRLKPAEFDALFGTMDADNSGLIDGVEFIRYFFHLGNDAKQLIASETKELQRRKKERMQEKEAKAILKEIAWQKSQIASFKRSDWRSVRRKLRQAAFLYDPNNDLDHSILHRLKGFLNPYHFQQQISKSFSAQGMQIHFSGAELASLIYAYRVSASNTDQTQSHPSDCEEATSQIQSVDFQRQQQPQQAQQQKSKKKLSFSTVVSSSSASSATSSLDDVHNVYGTSSSLPFSAQPSSSEKIPMRSALPQNQIYSSDGNKHKSGYIRKGIGELHAESEEDNSGRRNKKGRALPPLASTKQSSTHWSITDELSDDDADSKTKSNKSSGNRHTNRNGDIEQKDDDDEEEVFTMTDKDLDAQVDGYAFVTAFVHLSQYVWKEHNAQQKKLHSRRLRVLEMGQHTDIMPKSLGR